ncbi:MAG: hypothetical protein IJV62_04985 [Eggerthellaceae bacterium]|nr:hypothetical protein [Eggerthellaceae bacterium]
MNHPFQTYHPVAAFLFVVGGTVLAIAALHPVYAALAFLGAAIMSFVTNGVRLTLHSMLITVPVVLVVAGINPLISMSGSTELFRIGFHAIYLESILFGVTAAIVLASVVMWFQSYARCMDSENSQVIFGGTFPTVSLLITHVMRLVPQFIQRGRKVQETYDVVFSAATKRNRLKNALRTTHVLMAWGMQDSIERSDVMRARGYGGSKKRTVYKRYTLRAVDIWFSIVIVCLFLLAFAGIVLNMQVYEFSFYPAIGPFGSWFIYVPYVLYICIPGILSIRELLLWHK